MHYKIITITLITFYITIPHPGGEGILVITTIIIIALVTETQPHMMIITVRIVR